MKKCLAFIIMICCIWNLVGCNDDTRKNGTQGKTETGAEEVNLKYSVGDIITFGSYEQDNDTSNGAEPIEWRVLDVQEGKVLVVSKYGLDAKPYNETLEDVTWETCSLRQWLNTEFIDEAFSDEDKLKIPTVTVSADKNPEEDTNPGNDTMDKIFVLSMEEAKEYICNTEPHCTGTAYAFGQGAREMTDKGIGERCKWWTRTPGETNNKTVNANFSNYTHGYGQEVTGTDTAVRPAMWIELN